jgi:hypothetical protein
MVVIEKHGTSGIIYGPNVTYVWNCTAPGKTFEIDEKAFNEKVSLIKQGKPFEYETLSVELPEYMWLELAMGAHEKNITLNDYIAQIIKDAYDNSGILQSNGGQ